MPAMSMRETVKAMAGKAAATLSPQCRFDRAIFIIAHMRCGSTALSNILCTRPDVSGYGESHVRFNSREALGRLVVNQALRNAWKPRAHHLFDKILHNRHDAAAPEEFYQARAIFVARSPGAAIRSIRALYNGLGRDEYGTDHLAAQYYLSRLDAMQASWERFAPDRRIGLTHAALIENPDAALARISQGLSITPALENRYESLSASRKGGGGDPTASGRYTRIEPLTGTPKPDPVDALEIPDSQRRAVQKAYADFTALLKQSATPE